MIELVQVFVNLAQQIEAIMFYKMKQMNYYDALLFLYKNREPKLPSLTPTKYLETKDWFYAEKNLDNFEYLRTEKDWLSYFKRIYLTGSPYDIRKCRLEY